MLKEIFLFSFYITTVLATDYDETSRCAWNCYREYEGTLTTTISGNKCRDWTASDVTDDSNFRPHQMHNHCRRMNHKPLPWCYVEGDDETQWEYCFHFSCKFMPKNNHIPSNFCQRPGYFEFEGKCYTVLSNPASSRAVGAQMCTNQSSELLSLHSEKETRFVNSLTCLPKMVSARKRKGNWSWMASRETTWGMDENHWVWCNGNYYTHLTGNCASLMGLDCLAKVNCKNPQETLYPACVYTPQPAEIIVNVSNITWRGATEHCEALGRRLCGFDDLCNSQSINKWNPSAYKSIILPIFGDHWVPIANEYNEWIYVGNQVPGSSCKRHNKEFGPPPWGLHASLCEGNDSALYNDYCSAIGSVACCETRDKSAQSHPIQVPVYVHSRLEDGNPYYHYSKNENMTLAEIEEDRAEWRKYGRLPGDLRVFTLMSSFVEGEAEDPVYFCIRNAPDHSTGPARIHMISLKPCSKSWRLNFYLYGNTSSSRDKTITSFITVTSEESEGTTHSRVSERLFEHNLQSFNLQVPTLPKVVATPPQDPCQGAIERIKDKAGIISSPNYPDHYPKRRTPVKCSWKIAAEKMHLIKIKFINMKLTAKQKNKYFGPVKEYERFRSNHGERSFNHKQKCKEERVEISDPSGRQGEPDWVHYGVFCGDWNPHPFITTDNAVAVKFYGASSGKGKGFSLIFESIAPPRGLIMIKIKPKDRVQMTWLNARGKCREMNKDLCKVTDVCGIGRPFYGVERGNQWSPILDEFNDWVQIGEAKGQTCQTHNILYSPPQWGVTQSQCNDTGTSATPCAYKSILYCCNQLEQTDELLNKEILPVAKDVMVYVYTTVQNGRTFYRYIRKGIDTVNKSSIWTFTRKHTGDLARMIFYSHYKSGFDKVIYFCFKPLMLAIGRMRTVYKMSDKPCDVNEWKFLFYLYASSSLREGTKRIYVGISHLQPYHSRAHFGKFPPMFRDFKSFIIYAPSPDFVPSDTGEDASVSEDVIDTCSSTPVTVIAPSVLTSPGYPKKYSKSTDCKWRIRMSDADILGGFKLKITIEELHLEDRADTLLIYDAPLNMTIDQLTYSDAKEYSAVVRAVTLQTNNSFLLHFQSDYSIEEKGFKIFSEVINDKCGGIIRDHGSTITSMNYPQKYRGGLECLWTVVAPNNGYGIEIQFGKFELKDSVNCTEDYLIIGPASNPAKYRYCGVKNMPPRLQFNESNIELKFVTAEGKSTGNKGFTFNTFFWPLGNLARGGQSGTQCGMQQIQPWSGVGDIAKDRIVGGTEAIQGSWPWVVYIKEASCGGALLNERWVLTAGHCFAKQRIDDNWTLKQDISNYTITAGRHDRTANSKGEQVFEVERIIIHPGYKRVRRGEAGRSVSSGIPINDITLIKLRQTAMFTDTVSPICLSTQDVTVGESCVIAGWGAKEMIAVLSGDNQDVLHYAHVYNLANSLCNTYEALRGSLTEEMMCAGYPGGGVDSCSGDSGGPLMCKGPKGKYQIKGVVSWGRGCGIPNQPGIYTRVWSYYAWISNIIYT